LSGSAIAGHEGADWLEAARKCGYLGIARHSPLVSRDLLGAVGVQPTASRVALHREGMEVFLGRPTWDVPYLRCAVQGP
jgi:hypothetical protein